MARALLGMMLIVSQILTGFWGGSTLCLRSDGTVCCIHEVTKPCNCCDHDHGEDEVPCSGDLGTHCHPVCQIAGNDEPKHDDASLPNDAVPAALPLTATPPCGCRHLPLIAATAPTSQRSLSRTVTRLKQSHAAIPQVQSFHPTLCNDAVAECRRRHSPCCQTLGLTLAASTVIRC